MPASQNFRENLRTIMRAKGISQSKLAQLMGLKQPYVNDVLQGKLCPSLDRCEEFAKAVGFPVGALLHNPTEFSDAVLTVDKA